MQVAPAARRLTFTRGRALTTLATHRVGFVLALIAIYAFDAWALSPDGQIGDGSLRAFLFTMLAGIVAVAWYSLGDRTQGAVELGAGLIASSAIGAVVGPRIQESGFSVGDVSGVLALGGSVLLIVTGTTKLLHSARSGWARLLAIPIAWILVEFVVMPVAFAVYATNAPHPASTMSSPAQYGIYFEDIALTTEDGVTLSAWYIEGDNGSGVVMFHGAGSTKANVLEHAALLAEEGYSLVLLDARGHGESDGPIMDWGWYAASDAAPAIEFLDERVEGRIGLFGLSMGGESAITAAAVDERIAAVVSEGAGNRTTADHAAHAESFMDRLALAQSWITYAIADVLTPASPPMALDDAMRAVSPQGVLLISGRDDLEVEANMTWARAGGDTARVWVLRDTPHMAGYDTHPQKYEDKVIGFLNDNLLVEGSDEDV